MPRTLLSQDSSADVESGGAATIPETGVDLSGAVQSAVSEMSRWIEALVQSFAAARSDAIIRLKAAFDAEDIEIPLPIVTLDLPEGTETAR